ncbi:MAG TPA: hypothetical protein VGT61_08815 [Thermomicrobiales bacterium]|jgi:hypothetical protein|nr:hypothetical protein [Thermomicrobiales bacterium]
MVFGQRNVLPPEPDRLGRREEPDDQGVVRLADAVPASGYTARYRHEAGLPGLLDRSAFFRADSATVYPDTPRSPTIDVRIATPSNARYDVAWVEVRECPIASSAFRPGETTPRDQCDLVASLSERFDEPPVSVACVPIPTQPQAGLPGG